MENLTHRFISTPKFGEDCWNYRQFRQLDRRFPAKNTPNLTNKNLQQPQRPHSLFARSSCINKHAQYLHNPSRSTQCSTPGSAVSTSSASARSDNIKDAFSIADVNIHKLSITSTPDQLISPQICSNETAIVKHPKISKKSPLFQKFSLNFSSLNNSSQQTTQHRLSPLSSISVSLDLKSHLGYQAGTNNCFVDQSSMQRQLLQNFGQVPPTSNADNFKTANEITIPDFNIQSCIQTEQITPQHLPIYRYDINTQMFPHTSRDIHIKDNGEQSMAAMNGQHQYSQKPQSVRSQIRTATEAPSLRLLPQINDHSQITSAPLPLSTRQKVIFTMKQQIPSLLHEELKGQVEGKQQQLICENIQFSQSNQNSSTLAVLSEQKINQNGFVVTFQGSTRKSGHNQSLQSNGRNITDTRLRELQDQNILEGSMNCMQMQQFQQTKRFMIPLNDRKRQIGGKDQINQVNQILAHQNLECHQALSILKQQPNSLPNQQCLISSKDSESQIDQISVNTGRSTSHSVSRKIATLDNNLFITPLLYRVSKNKYQTKQNTVQDSLVEESPRCFSARKPICYKRETVLFQQNGIYAECKKVPKRILQKDLKLATPINTRSNSFCVSDDTERSIILSSPKPNFTSAFIDPAYNNLYNPEHSEETVECQKNYEKSTDKIIQGMFIKQKKILDLKYRRKLSSSSQEKDLLKQLDSVLSELRAAQK